VYLPSTHGQFYRPEHRYAQERLAYFMHREQRGIRVCCVGRRYARHKRTLARAASAPTDWVGGP
jgi:2-keto-4-pentenoate hydratase/2-oxohepta-3-ene-1,7-dioic acid hydratase in catechol pathway